MEGNRASPLVNSFHTDMNHMLVPRSPPSRICLCALETWTTAILSSISQEVEK